MEIKTPFEPSTKDEKDITDIFKKQTKRIFIAASIFLVVIGFIFCLILSFVSNNGKKENLKTTIDYIDNKHIQLSQVILNDSNENYIKAVYNCPGNNETCKFYREFGVTPISSMTINGEIVPVNYYYKFENSGVREVIIKLKEKFNFMFEFFENCKYLITVDFSNFDTSELTNIESMFRSCYNLTSIIWGPNFSTSKIASMAYLFSGCRNLKSIDLSKFNTSKVTDFSCMFNFCTSLKELDISSFDASNAIEISFMFSDCTSLTSINLSNFKPSKANKMRYMFNKCSSLKNVNFDNDIDARNVVSMEGMFELCTNLETVSFGDNFNARSVTMMAQMFNSCTSLKKVNFGTNFNAKSVTDMYNMFSECSSLKTVNFDNNIDTKSVTDMDYMFKDCSSLESLDLSYFNTSSVKKAYALFANCDNLVSIKQHFTFDSLNDFSLMFYNCRKLKQIDLSGIVGNNLLGASSMFFNCNSLTSIDISNLVAGRIPDTQKIFYNLPYTGNITYNSLKLNSNFLAGLPSGWTKVDVRFSR